MEIVNMHQAKSQLSRLVERVCAGEEIIIARAGKPVARLAPLERARNPRVPGLLKGRIWISKDFDVPLPDDLVDLFEGKTAPKPKAKRNVRKR
ncbi:MAG: type II toxin-antitoxin system Phd/YefM family antitoxin [Betaproteobacteria bacterium]|nr:type II toxin-antitoxin system Phd/YefM family antitoxin [Betaproteobacteria bacterium]